MYVLTLSQHPFKLKLFFTAENLWYLFPLLKQKLIYPFIYSQFSWELQLALFILEELALLPLCQSAKRGVSTAAWDLPGHLTFAASNSFGSFCFRAELRQRKKDTGGLIVVIERTEFERNCCLWFMMLKNQMHKPDCTFQMLKEKHDLSFRGQCFTSVFPKRSPSQWQEKNRSFLKEIKIQQWRLPLELTAEVHRE